MRLVLYVVAAWPPLEKSDMLLLMSLEKMTMILRKSMISMLRVKAHTGGIS